MSTEIATIQPGPTLVVSDADRGDTFADPAAFAHWQRVAGMFASSEVIPQHLRGHLPDVLIGLDLARRLRLNPLSVLQNLYVVKGTPGWKTSFLIALANSAGWDLDWEVVPGTPARLRWKRKTKDGIVDAEGDNLRVRCIMTRGGKKTGMWVSTEQAIAARWADNEQYTHSTELMLRYRAAAFAIRMYDPNLLLGLPTAEEAGDPPVERVVLTPDTPPLEAPLLGMAAVRAAVAPQTTANVAPPPPSQTTQPPSGGDAASGGGQPDPDQAERDRLIGELKQLGADLPEATRDSLRAQHELRRIDPKRVDLEKLRRLVEGTKRAVAERVALDGIVVPDPWPGPLDVGVLTDRIRRDLALVGTPGARQLMDRAKVAALDGAPEPGLRRLLVLTTEYLAENPPAPAPFDDPGSPIDPVLESELLEWETDLGDGLLCSAARAAGLQVTLAGPVMPESGADRRAYLLQLRAVGGGR